MHLAYSALQEQSKQTTTDHKSEENNYTSRYNAYQAICNKYTKEIAAIQKYLPGWTPAYPSY